uniref:hypothetical protein n=1 Tax=Roseomonas sp. 18066 TaxID=2681412 RepID=UPI00135A58D7
TPAAPPPLTARLLQGGAPWRLRARVIETAPEKVLHLGFRGPGAPETEIILPRPMGTAGRLRVVAMGGRQVVAASMEGNTGTGITQRLVVFIGCDAEERLRIIGIESRSAQETMQCTSETALENRLQADGQGGIRVHVSFARTRGDCGQQWDGKPYREAWTDRLTWDGRGPIGGLAVTRGAGPVRRAVVEARRRVAELLGPQPVTDLRGIDLAPTGLFNLVLIPSA